MSNSKNVISIAVGKNDSDLQNWLKQFPVSKKRYHFAERLEQVLAGNETNGLQMTREPHREQKDVKHIIYEQKEEYPNTNRYINYLMKHPEFGGISSNLKLLVRGKMIVDRKEWMKESAYIASTEDAVGRRKQGVAETPRASSPPMSSPVEALPSAVSASNQDDRQLATSVETKMVQASELLRKPEPIQEDKVLDDFTLKPSPAVPQFNVGNLASSQTSGSGGNEEPDVRSSSNLTPQSVPKLNPLMAKKLAQRKQNDE